MEKGRRAAVRVAVGGSVAADASVLLWPRLPLGWLLALHAIAYACFGWIILSGRRDAPGPHCGLTPRLLWAAGGVLLALSVARPPAQSHDLWSYLFYGRIVAVHHRSPYRVAPAAFPQDPWLLKVDAGWRHTRSVYGGLFTALSAVIVRAAGSSQVLARLLFQGLAAGAVAAAAAVVQRLTRSTVAAAAVVLNPLVILSIVNGGHNDALVGLGLFGAVVLARRGRPLAAGGALAAAALVKLSALISAGALVVWVLRRHGVRAAAATASAMTALVVAGTLLIGGTAALAPLRAASRRVSAATLWSPVRQAFTAQDTAELSPAARARANAEAEAEAARLAVGALAVAVVLGAVATRRSPDAAVAALSGVAAYLVVGSYVLPWYAGWGLPLAATRLRSRWAPVALGYAALLHLAYIPDYRGGDFFPVSPSAAGWLQTDLRTVVLPVVAAGLALWAAISIVRFRPASLRPA